MDFTAIGNFRAIDRFLQDPGDGAAALVHELGVGKSRILLRRAAGESNIGLFEGWGWAQIALGACLLPLLIPRGTRPAERNKLSVTLVCLMLLIVLISEFVLSPRIASLGRVVEFLPAQPPGPERKLFGMYHGISSSLELVKLALGLVATVVLLRRPTAIQTIAIQNG